MVLDGHIYRRVGQKPVHWSPSTGTALAEAELEYPDGHVSPSVYVSAPLLEAGPGASPDQTRALAGASLALWTTTPWTLPANRAVAVSVGMEYCVVEERAGARRRLVVATALREAVLARLGGGEDCDVGATWSTLCTLPGTALLGSRYEGPLTGDDGPRPVLDGSSFVTADSGTGLVHLAPGHGHEDFALAAAAGVAAVSPVDDAGRFTREAGHGLEGLEVLGEGGEAVAAAVAAAGRLLAREPYAHRYPYDWRSKRPVIVRTTRQWFASVSGLRGAALAALDDVRFVPGAGRRRIEAMVGGRSDWCISRQRAWGVPIPAFFYRESGEALMNEATLDHVTRIVEERGADAWWELPIEDLLPPQYRAEAVQLVKGSDTMDVWFDSGTSWASVLSEGGSAKDGTPPSPRFPADLYLEGSDQHRGWFQSSLLTAVAARGTAPYRRVLTHGFLLDEAGFKQSKSVGNTLDPRAVMLGGKDAKKEPAYGADVLRLWVASVDYTADASVSEVYRKIRLTLRFMLGNLSGFDPGQAAVPHAQLGLTDRYMLWRVAALIDECHAAYDEHQFFRVYQAIQRFCVTDLSNFYLDASKDRLYILGAASPDRRGAQTVLAATLRAMLALVAPLAPHLAEDAWAALPWPAPAESVFGGGAAAADPAWRDLPAADLGLMRALLAIRGEVNALQERARSAGLIGSSLEAAVDVHVSDAGLRARLAELQAAGDAQDTIQHACIVSQAALLDAAPGAGEGAVCTAAAVAIPGEEGAELRVRMRRAAGARCVRCWNYSEAVGADAEHPHLCHRCVPVVRALGQPAPTQAMA
ncbi:Isoleucine-tRNA ligase [Auxenochlorella protothecoides]|uniref:isoleucine--tRNA ligase n=2 Tax=Auxenochlorella protothecoides TaxID=3075 RepID=A0A087SEW5_AUXPR|nr:Isoleucine-tRNA ligase [Auxenochlorella protothecoides]KFM24269.1 Isoleucine-tRNA ligase [Auxenochlorella protothecoides]RMZ56188.1 hypothetical protein APUTEX25_002378 [Auxenochlorella protothecoides]|eukprot:RMZ56188.1 hypothetical protein APUTEX25_002378 [Auxenochlorella protothecoides]